jgi:hypothetical protein
MEELTRSLTVRYRTLSPARRGLLYTAALLLALFLLALVAPPKGQHPVPPSHSLVGTGGIRNREPLPDDLRDPASHTKEISPGLLSGGYLPEATLLLSQVSLAWPTRLKLPLLPRVCAFAFFPGGNSRPSPRLCGKAAHAWPALGQRPFGHPANPVLGVFLRTFGLKIDWPGGA